MRSISRALAGRSGLVSLVAFVALGVAACDGGDDRPRPAATASQTRAAETPASAQLLEGVFETGFEHSGFYLDTACPTGASPYWVSWVPELDFAQRIIEETGEDPFAEPSVAVFRLSVRGEVSAPGEYGHLGQYSRELVVHEVVSAEVASGCDSAAASELRLARECWEASGLVSYELRFQRFCECAREWAGPIEVEVENGVITSELFEGQPAIDGAGETIEGLFDAIEDALAGGVTTSVTYDSERGHPLEVQLDLEALAVDGGFSLEVLELRPLE